jgi:hypothetical protein
MLDHRNPIHVDAEPVPHLRQGGRQRSGTLSAESNAATDPDASSNANTGADPHTSTDTNPSAHPEEQRYLTAIQDQTQRMRYSLQRVQDLTKRMQKEPGLLFGNQWRIEVAVELATWKQIRDEARALTPPPRLASFHAFYLDALEKFAEAADDFAYGIDHLNAERIRAATDKIRQTNQSLEQARAAPAVEAYGR